MGKAQRTHVLQVVHEGTENLSTLRLLTHAPHLGEHARELLGEMGYGAGEIEKLSASGACQEFRVCGIT